MTTYYVRKTGNNSNAGTSAGAAWLTVAKALSVITSGDTVYIGAGTYRESGLSFTNTTAASMRYLIGDVSGQYTGDAGDVRITNFTTDDVTAPVVNAHMFNLTNTTYTTWQKLIFHFSTSGAFYPFNVSSASTNFAFQDCTFINTSPTGRPLYLGGAIAASSNVTIERCVFYNTPVYLLPSGLGVNNVNANIVVRNNFWVGMQYDGSFPYCLYLGGGSGTPYLVGGVYIVNNTMIGGYSVYAIYMSGFMGGTIPSRIENNIIFSYYGIVGVSPGYDILEDYNYIVANTARTNCRTGPNTLTNLTAAWTPCLGQDKLTSNFPKPFFMPTKESRTLGAARTSDTNPTTDLFNRPRPAGPGLCLSSKLHSIGCMELHDTAEKETTVVDTGTSIRLKGWSDQVLMVPVNDAQITVSIRVKWDANHGNGAKPRFVMLDNPLIGVTTQTVTATGTAASTNWETIATTAFTPTAKGWITLRLESRPDSATGIAYFDTLIVS